MYRTPHRPELLIVDDDDLVLRALGRLLRPYRDAWTIHLARNGADALAMIERTSPHVVVSDLDMPVLDGATLLSRLRKDRPDVVRIGITGDDTLTSTRRIFTSAHQLIAKPFMGKDFLSKLERAFALSTTLQSEALRRMVARDNQLPTPPGAYMRLSALLTQEDADIADVANLVQESPALVARLMQLTSSAFFGRTRPASNVAEAVMSIGLGQMRALVLHHAIVQMFETQVRGYSLEASQRRGLVAATLARQLVTDASLADAAYIAAIVHQVGQLVLASRSPKILEHCIKYAMEHHLTPAEAQHRVLGVTDADVGAYLLGIWGLPQVVVESVALQHRPERIDERQVGVKTAVYLAAKLSANPDVVARAPVKDFEAAIDLTLLGAAGAAERLDEMRSLARTLVGPSHPASQAPRRAAG